jgi:hypothetical protein
MLSLNQYVCTYLRHCNLKETQCPGQDYRFDRYVLHNHSTTAQLIVIGLILSQPDKE